MPDKNLTMPVDARTQAAHLRDIARQFSSDPELASIALEIAAEYDALADRVEDEDGSLE